MTSLATSGGESLLIVTSQSSCAPWRPLSAGFHATDDDGCQGSRSRRGRKCRGACVGAAVGCRVCCFHSGEFCSNVASLAETRRDPGRIPGILLSGGFVTSRAAGLEEAVTS